MPADDLKISNFDAAEYLRDEESIAAFLNASADLGDPTLLLNALSTVARARSMTALAQTSGLGRESLYKALKPGAQPRYDTVMKVISALGVRMVFTSSHHDLDVEQSASKAAAQKPKRREARVLATSKSRNVGRRTGLRAAAKSEVRSEKKRPQK